MRTERLDEQEWQVLHILEARFPGFTREVRHRFWTLTDDSRPELTPFEVASRIRKAFNLDLSDSSTPAREIDVNGEVSDV